MENDPYSMLRKFSRYPEVENYPCSMLRMACGNPAVENYPYSMLRKTSGYPEVENYPHLCLERLVGILQWRIILTAQIPYLHDKINDLPLFWEQSNWLFNTF